MKVKFVTYYKYSFDFIDSDGNTWTNVNQDSDTIYRWDVNAENEMVQEGDKWFLDGVEMRKVVP